MDYLEDKQSKYIREYVKNKEYSIVGTVRRHGFSRGDVNRQWAAIAKLIRDKRVDGVVVANMAVVSDSVPDAFYKVGQIIDAGGIIVTVDECRLDMNIRRNCSDGEE